MEFQLEEVAQTLWDCYRKRSDEIDNSCSLLSMVLHRALDWLHDAGHSVVIGAELIKSWKVVVIFPYQKDPNGQPLEHSFNNFFTQAENRYNVDMSLSQYEECTPDEKFVQTGNMTTWSLAQLLKPEVDEADSHCVFLPTSSSPPTRQNDNLIQRLLELKKPVSTNQGKVKFEHFEEFCNLLSDVKQQYQCK
jgi:hypothetical protein